MDRTRAWLVAAPLLGAGVLVAHGAAYRLTATTAATGHAYVEHAPQVLAVLLVVGVALAALTGHRTRPALWTFVAAAPSAFVLQEHLEPVAHTGQVPFLLDSPAFLLGLLLQLPVGVAAWLVARALLGPHEEPVRRRPSLPRALLALAAPGGLRIEGVSVLPRRGRGPPAHACR